MSRAAEASKRVDLPVFNSDRFATVSSAIKRFWDASSYEPTDWLWDFGDGSPIGQDTSPVHTFPAPGFCTVCLTVANQYSADSKCKVVDVKTVSSNPEASGQNVGKQVLLYPNPSTGQIFWTGLDGQEVRVRVFNQLGQVMADRRTTGNSLDLSTLLDGVYQVQFSCPEIKLLINRSILIQKR